MEFKSTSRDQKEVKITVEVDGQRYITETFLVEEFAVPYAVSAALIQLEEPDYDNALEGLFANGEPLPPET